MIQTYDLEEAYGGGADRAAAMTMYVPTCEAPSCFIGSYPPITPAGRMGPFFVNTYFLQDDRKKEVAGAVNVFN